MSPKCEAHTDPYAMNPCPIRPDWFIEGTGGHRLACDMHISHLCGEGTSQVTLLSECCQCEACLRDGPHASDCAVHSGPAYPNGPCNCYRGEQENR